MGPRPLLLTLLLAACAPLEGVDPPLLPYPGGFVRGRLVEGRFNLVLPTPPLMVDADGTSFYAAYPYQLLVHREGFPGSLPLPGIPRFIRAQPGLAVGLGEGVWTAQGLRPYRAQDALLRPEGLYWVDGEALYLEREVLARGSFRWVLPWGEGAVALGREAYLHPEGRWLALPASAKGAASTPCGPALLLEGEVWFLKEDGLKATGLKAQALAAWGEQVFLAPGGEVVSCKEVAWP